MAKILIFKYFFVNFVSFMFFYEWWEFNKAVESKTKQLMMELNLTALFHGQESST